jgi:nucleoside-diphosphate-sugar epimerase
MRVLVTGGAGFIGSHVVDALLARGHSVTVLDNLSTGKLSNFEAHLNNPCFAFIRDDIRNPEAVRSALEAIDAVVHEAAAKSVPLSFENPSLVREVNVGGTLNLLQTAAEKGIRRFLFVSSAAVYGEQEVMPIKESARPNPISPYAESKLAGERECLRFWREGLLETVCLRYFNVYGPRLTEDEYAGVMMRFAERIRSNSPPIIYGDGEQTRDFVNVRDVVSATLQALESKRAAGEIINVGSGVETTINELCKIFLETTGQTHLKPVYHPPRPGDLRHSWADLAKASKLLGYKPAVALREGVRELLSSLGFGVRS